MQFARRRSLPGSFAPPSPSYAQLAGPARLAPSLRTPRRSPAYKHMGRAACRNAAAAAFWDKANTSLPADFPIRVDEAAQVAVAEGGVSTRVLLDFLANYRSARPALCRAQGSSAVRVHTGGKLRALACESNAACTHWPEAGSLSLLKQCGTGACATYEAPGPPASFP